VSDSTDALVARLARDATPVRRLGSPMRRALTWLGIIGGLGAAAILTFSNLGEFAARARHPELIVELIGTLGTGILSTIAAFHLSVPDRSPRWTLLPLPTLALWLAGSGSGCIHEWLVLKRGAWSLGESGHCFLFIIGFGLPLSVLLLAALRRARPLAPLPVAVTGGLGAAALAAFLLQFFHPFDITFVDLGVHAFAVALIVVCCGTGGERLIQ
jgi:hypothetical protein